MITWGMALEEGKALLDELQDASFDARILFEYASGCNYSKIILNRDMPCDFYDEYIGLCKERLTGRPIQYITGEAIFYGYKYMVDERVLIPRFDTEVLVENALKVINESDRVLDMCTGSGCIGITIALEKRALVTASDLSNGALDVSRFNAKELGCEDRVTFIEGDLFENVTGRFKVIVSNPPYIAKKVIEGLDSTVKDHEPYMALDGGEDGLDIYRRLVVEGKAFLEAGGYVLYEIGYDQGDALRELLNDAGYSDITVIKDLAGLDRVVKARL